VGVPPLRGRALTPIPALNALEREPAAFGPRRSDAESLEPISKSPEEDNEAGELDKTQEVLCVVLPADKDPTLPLNPSKEALNEPSSHEAA
jgi:hypothetical protein